MAFANLMIGGQGREYSIDLMRHSPQAPAGVMDYLFTQIILWGKTQGYERFNLGMAPLAGLEGHPLGPLWIRAGQMLFLHGEYFYNFQGLRQYKEKYDPQWEPRYLASPGGLALPRIFVNVAALVAGGVRAIVSK